MTSPNTVRDWRDMLSRVSQALIFASALLGSSTAEAAPALSSTDSSSLTTIEWTSAASGGLSSPQHLPPQDTQRALEQLRNASRVLDAISDDPSSPPARHYLQSLGALLTPYAGATNLSHVDLSRITAGLGRARHELLAEAKGTPLHGTLTSPEPTPPAPRARQRQLARLHEHRLSPSLAEEDDLDALTHDNPPLVDLIVEALDVADPIFSSHARYRIEPFVDPESDSGKARVYLLVSTELPFEQADPLMEQLDEDWWLDNCDRAGGLLSISLEYV